MLLTLSCSLKMKMSLYGLFHYSEEKHHRALVCQLLTVQADKFVFLEVARKLWLLLNHCFHLCWYCHSQSKRILLFLWKANSSNAQIASQSKGPGPFQWEIRYSYRLLPNEVVPPNRTSLVEIFYCLQPSGETFSPCYILQYSMKTWSRVQVRWDMYEIVRWKRRFILSRLSDLALRWSELIHPFTYI